MADSNQGCAWITGASSGIGRAIALRMARDGRTVAASARRHEALDELAEEAAGLSGRIVAAPCDVTDPAQIAATVARLEADHGGIDTAILNAGVYLPDRADSLDAGKFRAQVELNVLGTVDCLHALMPGWVERRRGHLLVVSSVAGYRGLPSSLAYGATKAALINLCEGLKFDFDRLGLKIQLVNPGFVRTPLTDKNKFPMPFLMEVEDAADRVVDGMAGNSFEITFPRRFAYGLKLMRMLPYWAYFPLIRRATGLK